MCGIIGSFKTKANHYANESVVNQYEEQHGRGSEGFGVILINKRKEITVRRATEAAKFMYDLHMKQVPFMIAHHRFPTSSKNHLSQTHPLLVSHDSLDSDYLVVHNGVIGNAEALQKEHAELGFQYRTAHYVYPYTTSKEPSLKFNDSEALAIELARFIDGDSKIVGTRGAAAFIVVQIDKEKQTVKRIHFGRNDTNPLHMAKTRGELFLSSSGKGDNLSPHILYSCSLEGEMELSRKPIVWAPVIVHTYQSKSSTTQGAQGSPSAFPSIPVEKPITGFAPKPATTGGTASDALKYAPSSSGFLVPTHANSAHQQALALPGAPITDEDDDEAYNRWWETKARSGAVDALDPDEGFLGTQREDIEFTLEEFFENLADRSTCGVMSVDDTVKLIRNSLDSAKREAERIHNSLTDVPEDILYPYANAH